MTVRLQLLLIKVALMGCHDWACAMIRHTRPQQCGWNSSVSPEQLLTLENELLWHKTSPWWASSILGNDSVNQTLLRDSGCKCPKGCSESRSSSSRQASRMPVKMWEDLAQSEQHPDVGRCLSHTCEHSFLLPWPERVSGLKLFHVIQQHILTGFQNCEVYTYEIVPPT